MSSQILSAIVGVSQFEQVVVGRLNRTLEPTGLTFHDVRLLGLLSAASGCALLSSELSYHMAVQKSVTTHRVKGLEAKGAVTRRVLPEDKRKTLVVLTAKGKRSYDLASVLVSATLKPLEQVIDPEMVLTLTELTGIAERLQQRTAISYPNEA